MEPRIRPLYAFMACVEKTLPFFKVSTSDIVICSLECDSQVNTNAE
jgi:hypothetical protein